ncbi:OprO/OprP family phosphate-selective porin [Siccirubricoccus sp. KC 17139]|uniref:OprO/OprP family phosphate-selective porin n=1 Tax=Siccirubricoccus soli TaxID=2899147 RepID=A0ABT1CYJ7_9PROT|nr:porin [Siccirubricoccus soli]MCO6414738.1 OprO/OprP family phosphate-selective porin [Siccirubricoccus soli]MCP2680868.1 OprO/OprP family phosphate-selective porin [Siccirubricoccus soli]
MSQSSLRARLLLTAAGLALLSSPALAQDASRLQAIEQQIRSLQGELTRLRRDAAAREAETRAAREEAARARTDAAAARQQAAAAPAPAPAPAADQVRITMPGGRPTFTSADGRFQASVGGQVQWDIGGAIRGAPGNPNNRGVPDINSFGQNLRRARLPFSFRFDDFTLNVTPDFGGSPDGTPTLYEANFNWNPIRPLTLTLGYFKPYITLYDSISSSDFLMLERPSIVEVARSISAGDSRSSFAVRWAQDRFFAAAALTGDAYGTNSTQTVRGQTGFVGRIAGRPYVTQDADLHLGVSGSYAFDIRRQSTGQTLQLRDRVELRIDQNRLIDTGSLPIDSAYVVGGEFGARWRNFLLMGEYYQIGLEQSQAGSTPRPDLTVDGGYVEASWVITGEKHGYSAANGAFSRPNPARPFSFAGGGPGAWELAARYSVMDLNDKVTRGRAQTATGGVFGGRQEVIGTSLSWYPTNYLRFVLNWDIVNVDRLNAAGTTQIGQRFHTLALRTQLAF